MRGCDWDEMRLVKKKNGFYYLYIDRKHERSLRTKDKILAQQILEDERTAKRVKGIAHLDARKRILLAVFGDEYRQARRLQDICEGTRDNDELAIRRFMECVGNVPLRSVNSETIDKFKATMLDIGKSKTYINVLLRSLRAAFSFALEREYIDKNPFVRRVGRRAVLFRTDEEIPRFLTMGEIERILSVIDDRDFLVAIQIYLYAGLRRSELLRLHIRDVDLQNGFLYVRRTKGKRDRAVPLHVDLQKILREFITQDVGPLFPRWRAADTYSVLFQKYAKAAGIHARLHDLRHTFASYLAIAGVDIKRIKELLGHADIKTTERYAKLRKEELSPAVNALTFRKRG